MTKVNVTLVLAGVIFCLLLLPTLAMAANFTVITEPALAPSAPQFSFEKSPDAHTYNGIIKIFVVEPVSRYKDLYNAPYSFGLLSFAETRSFTLTASDTIRQTVTWNAGTYGPISSSNIKIIAVVYNGVKHTGYSDTPPLSPFDSYWVDAAVGVLPGEEATDGAAGSYTHNVFVDEGTKQN